MSVTNEFDDVLFDILKECKVLPAFFDVVFGFLKRRSDFYIVASDKNSPVGLPPGVAETLVRQKFQKWQADEPPKAPIEQPVRKALKSKPPGDSFTTSESYNGATYDTYSWSQTINDIDISVKIPENITKKQLSVCINKQSISVILNGVERPLLDGELSHKIKHNDAIWSVDKTKLEIHLDKTAEVWWDRLVTTEEPLDVAKMDCSRPFEELSQEAQAKIEELTWNQERKRLGLPTSDQIEMRDKLEKAWNAEGSPFSGPFDPESVAFN